MALGALSTWLTRCLVVALGALFLAVALSPMGLSAGRLPMPDPVFALIVICRLRRPEIMPLGLLVLLSLVSELVRGAPLGLGTLAMLATAELLSRYRERLLRAGFLAEWLTASALFVGQLAIQYVLLWLTFTPCPSLASLGFFAGATILSYPFVSLILRGLRPIEADRHSALGMR